MKDHIGAVAKQARHGELFALDCIFNIIVYLVDLPPTTQKQAKLNTGRMIRSGDVVVILHDANLLYAQYLHILTSHGAGYIWFDVGIQLRSL